MASVLRSPTLGAAALLDIVPPRPAAISSVSHKPFCVSITHKPSPSRSLSLFTSRRLLSLRSINFLSFASYGDTETTETEDQLQQPPPLQDTTDDVVGVKDGTSDDDVTGAEEIPTSAILSSLQSYREALANNDEARVAEIESFLKSIEDEKISLERKVASLSEEISIEKDRVLRISADFDNFRKRTERERLSLLTNAQGEVVENLLPVLDNFERAKAQIKVETEGEEKITASYQSINKQFVEILVSLGVVPVETVGNPFDPLLHEAIMREDSNEYEEGVIIQEFRKGFKLGDRLLRPSMVKVSAGPGPAKPEQEASSEGNDVSETTNEGSTEEGSTETDST